MSDDWQVVEEALTTYERRNEALAVLPRLREREAQLKAERDAWKRHRDQLNEFGKIQLALAEAAEARVVEEIERATENGRLAQANWDRAARLEEALREIAENSRDHRMRVIARRALAHEEPKGSMNNPITKDDLPMTVGPGEFWVAHEEEK